MMYYLQKLISRDEEVYLETWRSIIKSHDLEALKMVCPIGYRILNQDGLVIHDPKKQRLPA